MTSRNLSLIKFSAGGIVVIFHTSPIRGEFRYYVSGYWIFAGFACVRLLKYIAVIVGVKQNQFSV